MKKLLLVLVLVAGTFFCNAQVFIGGNIGYGYSSGTVEANYFNHDYTYDIPTTNTFSFVPTVGRMFKNNIGIGIDFGFYLTTTKEKSYTTSYNNNIVVRTYKEIIPEWVVAPYFRWVFGNFERVKLYADAKMNLSGYKTKCKEEKLGYTDKYDGQKAFMFGIGIVPGIKFMLNEHISLNGKLNILSLGYTHTKLVGGDYIEYSKDRSKDDVLKINEFGVGVNSKTDIELGLIYTF